MKTNITVVTPDNRGLTLHTVHDSIIPAAAPGDKAARLPGSVNYKGLLDSSMCGMDLDTERSCTDVTAAANDKCRQNNENVPIVLFDGDGITITNLDFPAGGRTLSTLKQELHHVVSGADVPGAFDALALDASKQQWVAPTFTSISPYLTLGTLLIIQVNVLQVSYFSVSVSNDPTLTYTAGAKPLPPVGWQREGVQYLRGNKKLGNLAFNTSRLRTGIFLPHFYLSSANMAVAQADIAKAQLIPNDAKYGYFATAGAKPGDKGMSFMVSTSIPVAGITAYPITNNNAQTPEQIARLFY